jgi:hypothetical protein
MPQKGYDTKTNRLTDCQSQCDFDFDSYRSTAYGSAGPHGPDVDTVQIMECIE